MTVLAVPLPPVLYLFNQLVKFVWLHLATVELLSMLYQAIINTNALGVQKLLKGSVKKL